MGRLTPKDWENQSNEIWLKLGYIQMSDEPFRTFLSESLQKLAHYEDLEEQGRLIEQKYGQWIYWHDEEGNTGNAQYECSECGAGDLHAKSQEVPYCWKCGAKMDEVEE